MRDIIRGAVHVLSGVATAAAVWEGAKIVKRGASIAGEAAVDVVQGNVELNFDGMRQVLGWGEATAVGTYGPFRPGGKLRPSPASKKKQKQQTKKLLKQARAKRKAAVKTERAHRAAAAASRPRRVPGGPAASGGRPRRMGPAPSGAAQQDPQLMRTYQAEAAAAEQVDPGGGYDYTYADPAEMAMLSRRARQLSTELDNRSEAAMAMDDYDSAEAYAAQAAAVAEWGDEPPASPAVIAVDPSLSAKAKAAMQAILDILKRKKGDDPQAVADAIEEDEVSPDDFGDYLDADEIDGFIQGWEDESSDVLGAHCDCGCGGVCGCDGAAPGHDHDHDHDHAHAPVVQGASPKAGGAMFLPDWAGDWASEALAPSIAPRASNDAGPVRGSSAYRPAASCKTGRCPMPK